MLQTTCQLFSTHRNLRRIVDKEGEDLSLRKHGCFGRNVRLLLKKHGEHNGGHGLVDIKQKIQNCGDQLQAWGSSKARPNNEDIKQLQKRLENLNMVVTTEASRAEFLEMSKELDDLLMK